MTAPSGRLAAGRPAVASASVETARGPGMLSPGRWSGSGGGVHDDRSVDNLDPAAPGILLRSDCQAGAVTVEPPPSLAPSAERQLRPAHVQLVLPRSRLSGKDPGIPVQAGLQRGRDRTPGWPGRERADPQLRGTVMLGCARDPGCAPCLRACAGAWSWRPMLRPFRRERPSFPRSVRSRHEKYVISRNSHILVICVQVSNSLRPEFMYSQDLTAEIRDAENSGPVLVRRGGASDGSQEAASGSGGVCRAWLQHAHVVGGAVGPTPSRRPCGRWPAVRVLRAGVD